MQFKNFYIWKGKLPHWSAEDVTYYTTFKHRRDLTSEEQEILFTTLFLIHGKKWNLKMLSVLPKETEILLTLDESLRQSSEISKVLEPAKRKASAKIQKLTAEKYPVFYGESYDRIMRDDEELQTFWHSILSHPVEYNLTTDPLTYPFLWFENN